MQYNIVAGESVFRMCSFMAKSPAYRQKVCIFSIVIFLERQPIIVVK